MSLRKARLQKEQEDSKMLQKYQQLMQILGGSPAEIRGKEPTSREKLTRSVYIVFENIEIFMICLFSLFSWVFSSIGLSEYKRKFAFVEFCLVAFVFVGMALGKGTDDSQASPDWLHVVLMSMCIFLAAPDPEEVALKEKFKLAETSGVKIEEYIAYCLELKEDRETSERWEVQKGGFTEPNLTYSPVRQTERQNEMELSDVEGFQQASYTYLFPTSSETEFEKLQMNRTALRNHAFLKLYLRYESELQDSKSSYFRFVRNMLCHQYSFNVYAAVFMKLKKHLCIIDTEGEIFTGLANARSYTPRRLE